jgi:hypothetical protein
MAATFSTERRMSNQFHRGRLETAQSATPSESIESSAPRFTFTDHATVCQRCTRAFRVSVETIATMRQEMDFAGADDASVAAAVDFCLRCALGVEVPEEKVARFAATIDRCQGCDEDQPDVTPYAITYNEHAGPLAGHSEVVRYCDDCAALARVNWNGTTAAIAPVSGGIVGVVA